MPRKLSTTDWLLIAFTLMLTVSAIGLTITIIYFGSGYSISAHKLNDKPENYFVLNNPDDYILEAITNGHSSVFKSLDITQFDELYDQLSGRSGFINIEYHSSYYKIGLVAVDDFLTIPALTLLAGVSLIGLVTVGSLKIAQHDKRKYYDKRKFSLTWSFWLT